MAVHYNYLQTGLHHQYVSNLSSSFTTIKYIITGCLVQPTKGQSNQWQYPSVINFPNSRVFFKNMIKKISNTNSLFDIIWYAEVSTKKDKRSFWGKEKENRAWSRKRHKIHNHQWNWNRPFVQLYYTTTLFDLGDTQRSKSAIKLFSVHSAKQSCWNT